MNKKRIILETSSWYVILNENQYHLGRCIVKLKRPCGHLGELKKSEWDNLLTIINKLEYSLRKAFGATMFNWTCLMNDAYKDENPKPKVHIHFRPRYKKEVVFEGLVFVDEEFAHHYDNKKKIEISAEIKEKIISKIKEYI